MQRKGKDEFCNSHKTPPKSQLVFRLGGPRILARDVANCSSFFASSLFLALFFFFFAHLIPLKCRRIQQVMLPKEAEPAASLVHLSLWSPALIFDIKAFSPRLILLKLQLLWKRVSGKEMIAKYSRQFPWTKYHLLPLLFLQYDPGALKVELLSKVDPTKSFLPMRMSTTTLSLELPT